MINLSDWNQWTSTPAGKAVLILILFLLAWIVFRLSGRIARYILGASRITSRQPDMRPERKETLSGLIAGVFAPTVLTILEAILVEIFGDANRIF